MNNITRRVESWETVQVRFNDFADLPTDESVESPVFTCFGHMWTIDVFPGGDDNSDNGMVALWLCNMTDEEIAIDFFISGGKIIKGEENANFKGIRHSSIGDYCSMISNFSTRAKLRRNLEDGALVIEARMKLANSSTGLPKPFIIENPFCKNMLKRFMDEETSDVIFEVAGESNRENKGSRKKVKTSPALFYAHKLILQDCAPMLYELCKSGGEIPIVDVKPDTFRHMLHYVYGGKVEENELEANAKEIIDASDKYGVVHLKLEAEAQYVKSTKMTVDNVMENLLYADAKNCALLKEAVMDYIVENGHEVVNSSKVSFENVPGYLMKDLMTAVNRDRKKKREGVSDDADDYSTMRVASLQAKLHEKGLDIDGSREAMIARLTEQSGAAAE